MLGGARNFHQRMMRCIAAWLVMTHHAKVVCLDTDFRMNESHASKKIVSLFHSQDFRSFVEQH